MPENNPPPIPLVDLAAQYRAIQSEIDAALQQVLQTTRFIGGPEVTGFEREWAAACGCSHTVGLASGTAALALALQAVGVGPGNEVITTTMTFVATAEAIVRLGATPVLVDVLPDTVCIDPEAARRAITGRTRALLPVHLYGCPADMSALRAIASDYGLGLVEDAAQAHGAAYAGCPVGSLGDVAAFSFYPGKNLGAYGDAGAITTSDEAMADRIARLADHGRARGTKYKHDLVGWNDRLDALQAAILRVKLRHLTAWNEARRAHAAAYDALLAPRGIERVGCTADATPVFHMYVVRVGATARPAIQAELAAQGIATGIHYPIPVHLQPAFGYLGRGRGSFPAAETLADTVLSLPMYPELTESDITRVAEGLVAAVDRAAP